MDVREQMRNIAATLDATENVAKEETTDKVKKISLEVSEPLQFDGMLKTKLITTNDLCVEINKFFNQCLADYEGCILEPDANGNFNLKIYLSYKPNSNSNLLKCLEKIGAGEIKSPVDRLMNFNISQRNKMYNLTKEAKEALEDFVITGPNKKVDWSRAAAEFTDTSVYGASNKIYTVVYLDVYKVIKKMYGTKIPGGGYVDYKIMAVRPIVNDGYMSAVANKNYLLSIMQLDNKLVNEISIKVGMIPQDTTGFAIVRNS